MRTAIYRSFVLTAIMLVIVGAAYPLAGWAFAQATFSHQADGSLGRNGSSLIGQPWNSGTSINPQWFNGRPDADNPLSVNGVAGESSAANLGPRSEALVTSVRALIKEWRAVGVSPTPDLVTTSGSGIDPDISPLDARVQVPMVSRARHIPAARLYQLISQQTRGPQWGFLGSSYVNVLSLNEALSTLRP